MFHGAVALKQTELRITWGDGRQKLMVADSALHALHHRSAAVAQHEGPARRGDVHRVPDLQIAMDEAASGTVLLELHADPVVGRAGIVGQRVVPDDPRSQA